jgi:hypothetical protein
MLLPLFWLPTPTGLPAGLEVESPESLPNKTMPAIRLGIESEFSFFDCVIERKIRGRCRLEPLSQLGER